MCLDKWYLDAVFPDGTVWFGYRAQLRLWCWPKISWVSGCEVPPRGPERSISRWQKLDEPILESGQWRWAGPDGFQARWRPSAPGRECLLATDEQLTIRWNCRAPMAAVTRIGAAGQHGNQAAVEGLGYLEHLQIETSRPCLPFRELRWGRAHASGSSLVWIHWGRGRDLSLLLENGVRVRGEFGPFATGGMHVETDWGEWQTGNVRLLCDRDVRRSFPPWLVWLVKGLAPARETKMTGAVRLRTGADEFAGSAIWEEVKWI